jgi:CRISPR/Cas system-associated exonuclease Cas4 (RecB family)
LVFVGASDLAQFWWCAQQSLLRVRDYELGVFANYVFESARVITPDLDKEMAKLLIYGLMQMDGGRGLRLLEFVDRFYKKRVPDEVLKSVVERTAGGCRENNRTLIRRDDKLIVLGEGGKEVDECDLIKGEYGDICREELRARCAVSDREERGRSLEETSVEMPTIFWAKEWDRYIIAGASDGIGEDFVYEFKSTVFSNSAKYKWRIDNSVLPVTRTQANIYAWLFNKRRWVVEIFSCADLRLYKWEGEADYGDVERTLKGFKAAEEGGEILPPACWKCERCEYKDHCEVKDKCKPSRRQGI